MKNPYPFLEAQGITDKRVLKAIHSLLREFFVSEDYKKLSQKAQKILKKLVFQNIKYKVGNGKEGWKKFAPFDKIIITAAAQEIPSSLLEQLKSGGKIIFPLELDTGEQYLFLVSKL